MEKVGGVVMLLIVLLVFIPTNKTVRPVYKTVIELTEDNGIPEHVIKNLGKNPATVVIDDGTELIIEPGRTVPWRITKLAPEVSIVVLGTDGDNGKQYKQPFDGTTDVVWEIFDDE